MNLKIVHLNLPPLPLERARELLAPLDAEVVPLECRTGDELVARAPDADAIIGAALGPLLTRETLSRLPRLRHVSLWSGSTDYLDLPAFTDSRVVVSFAADACTDEIADHSMAMMLALARKLTHWDSVMRERKGIYVPHEPIVEGGRPMPRLSTLTCGMFGLGRAGMALALRARAFGMKVLAFDPFVAAGTGADLGVDLTTKERMLSESDFVHICVPMKKDTEHIVGAAELALMKPTASLVNCSARAAVVDQVALATALASGRLAGAGLDVLEMVTDDESPILTMPNVILSPHVAHVSEQAYESMRVRICEDVVTFFTGGWPQLIANPAVKQEVARRP